MAPCHSSNTRSGLCPFGTAERKAVLWCFLQEVTLQLETTWCQERIVWAPTLFVRIISWASSPKCTSITKWTLLTFFQPWSCQSHSAWFSTASSASVAQVPTLSKDHIWKATQNMNLWEKNSVFPSISAPSLLSWEGVRTAKHGD